MTAAKIEVERHVEMTVPARAAALAWLNAFLATSEDPDRPLLYRTLSVEFFLFGIQIVGCDGTALFRSWVPTQDDGKERSRRNRHWPHDDLAPFKTIVVMDPDGFGKGFMATLLRVTAVDGHEFEELHIATASVDDEAAPALGGEFQTERLILRACGQRLDLRVMEDRYPDWRKLDLGYGGQRLDGLTISPRLLGLLGKLKEVSQVDLDFHGEERHIGFTARGEGQERVRGLIMPMRRPEVKQAKAKVDPQSELTEE